jgi:hypothetical protein
MSVTHTQPDGQRHAPKASGSDSSAGKPDVRSRGVILAIRILVTIFCLPFFVLGLSMLLGTGAFGSPLGNLGPGMSGGIHIFAIGFLAVPTLIVIVVWLAKPSRTNSAASPLRDASTSHVLTTTCSYCGLPRAINPPTRCEGCGAAK